MNRIHPEARMTIKTLAARGATNSHIACPENEVFQLGAESVTIPLVESRGRGESSGLHNDARGHPRCGGCSRPRHARTSRAEARPLRARRYLLAWLFTTPCNRFSS